VKFIDTDLGPSGDSCCVPGEATPELKYDVAGPHSGWSKPAQTAGIHAFAYGPSHIRPYCRAISTMSAIRYSSSSRHGRILRCVQRCCPSAAQVRRLESTHASDMRDTESPKPAARCLQLLQPFDLVAL